MKELQGTSCRNKMSQVEMVRTCVFMSILICKENVTKRRKAWLEYFLRPFEIWMFTPETNQTWYPVQRVPKFLFTGLNRVTNRNTTRV